MAQSIGLQRVEGDLPPSRKGPAVKHDKYLDVLEEVAQLADEGDNGVWFSINTFDYKQGARNERRKLESGYYDVPDLLNGYIWEFQTRTVEDEDGNLTASALYARVGHLDVG